MSRILLALSHAIEEYDQLKLLHSIGHEVFSIGAYIDPGHPHVPIRPPLPEVPFYPELKAAVDGIGKPDNLGAAQMDLPDALLDWADILIYHHYLDQRLVPQWPRLRDWLRGSSERRIIWRSVGQSVEYNERTMQSLRAEGLERVAYSPKEANIPGYSGHDALIRFYKDPDEWSGWVGDYPAVVNITQQLRQRDPYTNWRYWAEATRGLARPREEGGPAGPYALALGPGSEALGGPGELTYDAMRVWLRRARSYCYTGTQPASYTLGLIEAMMTGIPVVSIGPAWMRIFPYSPDLFEGHELASYWSDDPDKARGSLNELFANAEFAALISRDTRARAIELFGMATIAEQWRSFLGVGVPA